MDRYFTIILNERTKQGKPSSLSHRDRRKPHGSEDATAGTRIYAILNASSYVVGNRLADADRCTSGHQCKAQHENGGQILNQWTSAFDVRCTDGLAWYFSWILLPTLDCANARQARLSCCSCFSRSV